MFTYLEKFLSTKLNKNLEGYGVYIDSLFLAILVFIGSYKLGKKIQYKYINNSSICKINDSHFIFESDGNIYIVRTCEGNDIELIPLNDKYENVEISINGNTYYASCDDIEIYNDNNIKLEYENELIKKGIKVLKK